MNCHPHRVGAALALMAALFCGSTAHAVSTLDQAFEGPVFTTSTGLNSGLYRAQTFTVGLSGLLTRFEVVLSASAGGTSDFEIWSTTGGASEAIPGDVQALVQIGGNSTGSGS